MVEQQQKLVLSPYMDIYELVIPKDNLLRQIKELVDFRFIYEELIDKYCLDNGRNAVPPVRMFKYLLLKSIYNLSDIDVVERSKYDMSFKYFLDMAPEESVINPSSLTKFRKLRLKDMNLLDMLVTKTVRIALEKGIIKSRSIIVDATHTRSRYNQKTPRQALLEQSKKLRHAVYEIDGTMKEQFPDKNTEDSLEKELAYCHALISVIKEKDGLCSYPKVREKLNLLEESVNDDLEHIETSRDADAKTGHKTADSSFFGYKTHIAMSEECIITAATVTSGEKTDGKELPELVRKSREAGMEVEMVIGDTAYSEQKNIEAAEDGGYELISRLLAVAVLDNLRFHQHAGESLRSIAGSPTDFHLQRISEICTHLGSEHIHFPFFKFEGWCHQPVIHISVAVEPGFERLVISIPTPGRTVVIDIVDGKRLPSVFVIKHYRIRRRDRASPKFARNRIGRSIFAIIC